MSDKDQAERKQNIQIIEQLYPPDSKYQDIADLGDQFMLWALKLFLSKFKNNWRELDDEILSHMAYYCERHERMTENRNRNKGKYDV